MFNLGLSQDREEGVWRPTLLDDLENIVAIQANNWGSSFVTRQGHIFKFAPRVSDKIFRVGEIDGVKKVLGDGISESGRFTVALKNDGTVWVIDAQGYGVRGDGSDEPTLPDQFIKTDIDGVVDIVHDANSGFVAALRVDGTVWQWGATQDNISFAEIHRLSPTLIEGTENTVGLGHHDGLNLLHEDGTIRKWWLEQFETIPILPPMKKVWDKHAIDVQGNVWFFSRKFASDPPFFVFPIDGINDIVSISDGAAHLALDKHGTVWGWGTNIHGAAGRDPEIRVDELELFLPTSIITSSPIE